VQSSDKSEPGDSTEQREELTTKYETLETQKTQEPYLRSSNHPGRFHGFRRLRLLFFAVLRLCVSRSVCLSQSPARSDPKPQTGDISHEIRNQCIGSHAKPQSRKKNARILITFSESSPKAFHLRGSLNGLIFRHDGGTEAFRGKGKQAVVHFGDFGNGAQGSEIGQCQRFQTTAGNSFGQLHALFPKAVHFLKCLGSA